MPLVGFLPATDPRVLGTVEAIQKHLMSDGLVARYQTTPELDGLPPGEGAFLPCVLAHAATAQPSTARRVDDAGGYAGCSLKENRRLEPSSRSRSSEYRSCVQISKQRRWRCMALLPGLPARPFIASWPVPMVMSQPTHGSPVAERPSTFAAFSRGRRPLSSFLRMIWRIVPKSISSLMAAGDEIGHQVFPSASECSFPQRQSSGQARLISCISVS